MIDTFSQDFNNIESSDDEKPDCESNIFIRKLTSSPSVNEIETIKEDVKEVILKIILDKA